MKKCRIICVLSAVAALLSVSCSKENSTIDPKNPEEAKTIQISINGEFSDFASTKGSVESIFRMKWAAGDKVYVYGQKNGESEISLLSETPLTATIVSGSDNRVADLSGTITAPTADTKLTLVYSPLFTSAPTFSGGAVTQSLAAQEGGAGDVTFIAYATVDYGGTTTSTYRTSFKFATSVLRVNVSGMDKSQVLTKATITGIETACKLTISTSAEPAIEGVYAKNDETDITSITRNFTSVSTNAKGYIAFYVALPVTTANADRSLSIAEKGSRTYLYPKFATKAVEAGGNMLNTIAAIPTPVKYTENSIDLGYGTFIPETGVIWAPANCGYSTSGDYGTYGLLYQWGRKYGQSNSGTITPTVMTKSDDTVANKDKFGKSNETTYNWFSGAVDNTLWNGSSKGTSDPCPTGWRVPTETEFNALISQKAWGTNTVGTVSQTGYWFNGSSMATVGTGVFLPAAGYRIRSTGYATNRNSYGYYWSSSVNGNKGRVMGFNYGIASIYDDSRAHGYSVRCVQE